MENAGSAPMLRLTGAPRSARRPHLSQLETLWVAVTLLGLTLVGCSSSESHGPTLADGDGGPNMPRPTALACDTPNEGCECEDQDEVVDCALAPVVVDSARARAQRWIVRRSMPRAAAVWTLFPPKRRSA